MSSSIDRLLYLHEPRRGTDSLVQVEGTAWGSGCTALYSRRLQAWWMNVEQIHPWLVICHIGGGDGHFVLPLRLVVGTSASIFASFGFWLCIWLVR